jgi:spore maturation protein CgeB
VTTGIKERLKNLPVARGLNAAIKGPLQEFAAARSLWRYKALARLHGVRAPDGESLQDALRKRVSTRRCGRPPLAKGGMHVFLAYRLWNWEGVLPRALAPFGRVSTFEWSSLGFDDLAPSWLLHRAEMNAAMLEAFDKANSSAPVDAFVGYLGGLNTLPGTLIAIAQRGAVLFNFCLDDKLRFPGAKVGGSYVSPAAIARNVDLNLTNAPSSTVKYAVHGGLAAFFPEAAHPDVHRPVDSSYDFDVSFVGACYGWRPRFIDELKRHGVRVECFGSGWPNGALSDEEMVRLYSRSRINLGFGGIGYSRRLMCLKGRDFEVPMSGGLYLTQHNPELDLVFDVGREIVTYRDERDCAGKIRQLLAQPEEARRIREAGRARCLRDHTYEARWTKAFELAGLL